jgi:predicted HTH transcriptional regulator/tetratricopeptide (TPR) repeat protein
MSQKRYAYLIGANGPQQQPHVIEPLKYAEKDIGRLEAALSAHPCAFTEVNSIIANTPTSVIEGLELLTRKCEQSDLLVVHFSGHGYVDKHLYLICNETDVERKLFTSGAIKIDQIKDILQDCPARHKLLILDCCHAAAANAGGTWTKGILDLEQSLGELKGNANIILSACASNRTARELDTLEINNEHGAGFLSWAITRACSEDFVQASHDQALSLNDIWRWVKKAQEEVNQSLPPATKPIPLPRLFGEQEGQDDEIWFTSRRRKTIEDKHDELKQHEELATHEQEEFLRQYCFGANVEDFDRTKLLEYAQRQRDYDKLPTNNILELCQQLGLTSGTGMPRREAVLAFHPIPSRYLSSAFIRVFASGSGSNEYTSGDLEGSLADQAKMAEVWLLNRLEKIAANIGPGERTERCEIPERALRELIVNAIVHRDYKANESIHIKITPKQVIITNPGRLDPAIMACNPPFAYSESHPRNSQLLRILTTQKWAEGNALGFEIVREEFEKYGLPLPEIKNLPGGLVKVIIQRPDLSSISRNETITNTSPIWNVPYRRNPSFTGREQVLAKLANVLQTEQNAALSQSYAISGLGGIGKTQIAIEYAYRYRNEYHDVFWVQANSCETFITDIAKITALLHLPEQNSRETALIIQAVKHWLEVNTSWLLILDNADDLSIAKDILPSKNSGHILFTTRATAMGNIAKRVEIDEMDMEEGALLLLRRAKILTLDAPLESAPEADLATARTIAKAMVSLPLAIDQAGAYIEEMGCNLSDYLQLYLKQPTDLLQERGERKDYHPDPVAKTWALSFEKVQQANPAAADLLRFCAFLAPDDIPEEIIIEAPKDIGTELQSLVGNQHKLNLAIRELLKYSLIRRDSSRHTIVVHRLVQAVLRNEMDEEMQQKWAERAVRAVNQIFPIATAETWAQCQHYLANAITCAELIEQYNLVFPEAARLLEQVAIYEMTRAMYSEAEPLFRKSLSIREQVLGLDHPDIAQSLNNLALLYYKQGRYEETEPLYQRALAIRELVAGSEHPDTAQSLNNLALLYQNQGKYDEAESLYKQAIAILEAILGPNHPDIAQSLNNLALHYYNQGQDEEAEPLYQRALAIREQALGPDHPDTAISLNSLAGLYEKQNLYQEAEPLYQRALGIREQAFGSDHPDTAISLNNLASLYARQHRYQEAEPLYQRALAIREQTLGPDHLDTAINLNNLASLYYYQGRFQEAEPLYQRAFAISKHVLGSEHPYAQAISRNYARLLQQIGHNAEATQGEHED